MSMCWLSTRRTLSFSSFRHITCSTESKIKEFRNIIFGIFMLWIIKLWNGFLLLPMGGSDEWGGKNYSQFIHSWSASVALNCYNILCKCFRRYMFVYWNVEMHIRIYKITRITLSSFYDLWCVGGFNVEEEVEQHLIYNRWNFSNFVFARCLTWFQPYRNVWMH